MSTDVFGGRSRIVASRRLPALLTGFSRFVRAVFASHRAEKELEALPDHYLQDVGVDPRQISHRVEREITRHHLIEMGWRGSPGR